MYDWITASYSLDPTFEGNTRERYVGRIVQISEVKSFFTDTIWSNGYITNSTNGRKMGVNISDKRIRVLMCPNKLILGNNSQEAPISKIQNVLEGVSNTLELPLEDFIIEKLDITHTAITDFIPEVYFEYLCNQGGFLRWVQNTSLYYDAKQDNIRVKKVLYDKVNHVLNGQRKMWGGRQKLPDELKGKNLARFECRLGTNKEVQKVIGGQATLGQLFKEEHIMQLQKWWWNQYDTIPKTTEINWKFTNDMGEKRIKDTINHLGYMALGKVSIENLIELADKQGGFKYRQQKSRLKKELLGAFENGEKHSHIKELDEKYKNAEPKW
tara:strand:- start:1681 stop:2658 length:978 start_codon:yes stop_codon:yes gene_type:complete